jgi:hypothetical protein
MMTAEELEMDIPARPKTQITRRINMVVGYDEPVGY